MSSFLTNLLLSLVYYLWLFYDLFKSKLISSLPYSRLLSRLQSSNSQGLKLLAMGIGDSYASNSLIFSQIPLKTHIFSPECGIFKLFRFKNQENLEFINKKQLFGLKFDVILFTSHTFGFPRLEKQLKTALSGLKPNGRLLFVLALFKNKGVVLRQLRGLFQGFWEKGEKALMTEKEFLGMLKRNRLTVSYKERVKAKNNPFLSFFRFFVVEAMLEL